MAASRKEAKYAALQTHHTFQPTTMETLGPISDSACALLDDLGWRISVLSGDERDHLFLFRRISVVINRFNVVLSRVYTKQNVADNNVMLPGNMLPGVNAVYCTTVFPLMTTQTIVFTPNFFLFL